MHSESIRQHLDRSLEDNRRRDLHEHVRPVYGTFCVIFAVGTLIAALHQGTQAVGRVAAILGLSLAAFIGLSARMRRSTNTERSLVALHTMVPIAFAAVVANTGGTASGALPLFATSAAYAGARFRGRRLAAIQIEIALVALLGCYLGGASTLRATQRTTSCSSRR